MISLIQNSPNICLPLKKKKWVRFESEVKTKFLEPLSQIFKFKF